MSLIATRVEGRVGIITMKNMPTLNSLSKELMGEVTEALNVFKADPEVRAIVLNAEGRAFCSGFDLKASAASTDKTVASWRAALEYDFDFIMQFWDCPKPTIAAVHGAAVAGGFELALACDITVVAEGTRIGEPEVRFGSAMVVLLLPWLIASKPAREILLLGDDAIDLQRAQQLGIVNHVVPKGRETDKAIDLAWRIASCAPISIEMTKRAINRTYEAMGMRQALLNALDVCVLIDTTGSVEREEFNRIVRAEGLKSALAWRDRQAQRPGVSA